MTRIPTLLRKLVGLITIGMLGIFIHNLATEKGFNVGEYVTEVAVALTILAISIAYWSFRPDLEKLSFMVAERDREFEKVEINKELEKAEDHRKKLNDGFLVRRAQIYMYVFTWAETFQSNPDSKHYLQHLYTGHPELYDELEKLMIIELENKKLPKPIPLELRKKEDQARDNFRPKFDELQSKIRQGTEDIGGYCDNCLKFYINTKDFKTMRKKLKSFKMPF